MLRNESYGFPPLASGLVTHDNNSVLKDYSEGKESCKSIREPCFIDTECNRSFIMVTHLWCQSVVDKITGEKVTIILLNQERMLVKETFLALFHSI